MKIRKMGNTGKCTFVMQEKSTATYCLQCLQCQNGFFFKSNQLRSNFEAFAPDQSSKAQSPGSTHALNQHPMIHVSLQQPAI